MRDIGAREVQITTSLRALKVALAATHAIGIVAEKPENRREALEAYDELYRQWCAALADIRAGGKSEVIAP